MEPLFVGVSVTGPADVGVIVNVCAAAVFLKFKMTAFESPPPDGVIVMLPV